MKSTQSKYRQIWEDIFGFVDNSAIVHKQKSF